MSFWSRAGVVCVIGAACSGLGALGACSAGGGDGGGSSGSQAGAGVGGSAGSTAGNVGTVAGASASAGGSSGGSADGSAGATAGGAAGSSVTGGGSAGAGGAGGSSGGGVLCPVDATFCSSFEDSAMPAKAVYKFNAAPGGWTRDFEVDSLQFHGGKSSLRVKSGSADAGASGAYQMLAVPAPSGAFWVRFYIQQTELDIGGADHNVFAGAADTDEPNSPAMIELAEDVGLAFNTNDAVRWPMNYGRINGNPMPFSLPKGMWHCIEINFDGQKREQKLFVNGALQIAATDYPASVASPVKIFKFGFNKLHGPARKVWFDDVAVGPTRAGCL